MKTLPDDASSDQSGNIPTGYYRRNTGMLNMLPDEATNPQSPALSVDDVKAMTQAERDEAILLRLSILALTSTEAKAVVSTAKEYFDRMRGKAAISITQNSTVAMLVASVQPDVDLLRRIKQELLDGTITLDN